MKKVSLFLAALAVAAVSFTSCQKEESTANKQQFIASLEQTVSDKISANANLQMHWSEDIATSMVYIYVEPYPTVTWSTTYAPTSISTDKKTAVLEHNFSTSIAPFPDGQEGPFYAITNAIRHDSCYIENGTFVVRGISPSTLANNGVLPMVARADNFGNLQFKHLFGILKANVEVPEGYEVNGVYLNVINGSYNPLTLKRAVVTWNANGEIEISDVLNVARNGHYDSFREGNGFYYLPACCGDWNNLEFVVSAVSENLNQVAFVKVMNPQAFIHIERAGITTVTLRMTQDDMVD